MPLDGPLRMVWVDPRTQARSDPGCAGARELPFLVGFEPSNWAPCGGDVLGDFLGQADIGLSAPSEPEPEPSARDDGWRYANDPSAPPVAGPR